MNFKYKILIIIKLFCCTLSFCFSFFFVVGKSCLFFFVLTMDVSLGEGSEVLKVERIGAHSHIHGLGFFSSSSSSSLKLFKFFSLLFFFFKVWEIPSTPKMFHKDW